MMLVLKRRVDGRIRVTTPAGDVWVTLVGVWRGGARIGIDAPRACRIEREELLADGTPPGGGATGGPRPTGDEAEGDVPS